MKEVLRGKLKGTKETNWWIKKLLGEMASFQYFTNNAHTQSLSV